MVWSHRLAVLLSISTAVLILLGGLVTSTGAALAVPDWPTTFGYHMFLYPWSKMTGGIFYEHSHRLIGSLVGFLTVLLAVGLWVAEAPRWLRGLGLLAVIGVSLQGLLGGLRVILLQETLAILHGSLAPAFFGLTVALVLFTSREWTHAPKVTPTSVPTPSLRRLALWTTAVVYLQIVFGVLLTHGGRVEAHLVGAVGLLVLIPMLGVQVMRRHPDTPGLLGPAIGMELLFIVQLFLGLGSYAVRFTSLALPLASLAGIVLPVAHRLIGALLLGVCLLITLKLGHLGLSAQERSALLPLKIKGLPA